MLVEYIRNKKYIIFAIIAIVVVGVALFLSVNKQNKQQQQSQCATKIEERIVRGDSMAGILEQDAKIKVSVGYYNCNEVARGDIIVYRRTEKEEIIKKVYGIPADHFEIKKFDDGYWRIVMNGDVAKTSRGEEYILDERTHKMLALYEKDYKGVVPSGAYIILGNIHTGSVDSTRFGLAGRKGIIGKVLIEK